MSDDGLGDVAAPNCPVDLVTMELDDTGDDVHWTCPECGRVRFY
jgi:hypothetical protein